MEEEEDDDDMYAPAEIIVPGQGVHANNGTGNAPVKREGRSGEEDGEEEGEEVEEVEEDESDSVVALAISVLIEFLTVLP